MKGSEAQEIINELDDIYYNLIRTGPCRRIYERQAFYQLGKLSQRLEHIVVVDMVSFNPTVHKKDEEC
ncbi:MAG: hypothetical protein ACXVHM_03090 [Methanobacterium sp.]